MKKFLRLIVKIVLAPIVIFLLLFTAGYFVVFSFFQWLFDASDFSKSITDDCFADIGKMARAWFTKI